MDPAVDSGATGFVGGGREGFERTVGDADPVGGGGEGDVVPAEPESESLGRGAREGRVARGVSGEGRSGQEWAPVGVGSNQTTVGRRVGLHNGRHGPPAVVGELGPPARDGGVGLGGGELSKQASFVGQGVGLALRLLLVEDLGCNLLPETRRGRRDTGVLRPEHGNVGLVVGAHSRVDVTKHIDIKDVFGVAGRAERVGRGGLCKDVVAFGFDGRVVARLGIGVGGGARNGGNAKRFY